MEVKYTLTPKPRRGFRQAYGDLRCRAGYIVYPGEEEYHVGEGVRALPVSEVEKVFE